LKELYVERLCLCIEFWLGGYYPEESAQKIAHEIAAAAIEKRIRERDPDTQILDAFQLEGDGKLNPCHHKLFRRYDIIISSIGAGKWRKAMPRDGTDGFERAEILERYLSPIQTWIDAGHGARQDEKGRANDLSDKIHTLLGVPDDEKLFLASLLHSLLYSQQLAAKMLAESRTNKKQ
jgi:hypothetical protein